MQFICSIITLMFMNGSYVFISYDMESVIEQTSEDTEEVATVYDPSRSFELADILDLDLLDFDVEELADSQEDADELNIVIRSKNLVVRMI